MKIAMKLRENCPFLETLLIPPKVPFNNDLHVEADADMTNVEIMKKIQILVISSYPFSKSKGEKRKSFLGFMKNVNEMKSFDTKSFMVR